MLIMIHIEQICKMDVGHVAKEAAHINNTAAYSIRALRLTFDRKRNIQTSPPPFQNFT